MIRAYCKRVLLFLPFLVCYFLAVGIAMLGIAMNASAFLFDENTDKAVSMAVCVPDEDSYTRLGLNFIKNMDSVKYTVNLEVVTKREEAVRLVENQDAVAALIIPEGFIETMGTEDAVSASIIYRDADTFEEHIANDLIYAMSDFLGISQCAIITAREYAAENGIEYQEAFIIETSVMNNCYQYVMGRGLLFRKIDADDIVAKYKLEEQLIASYTLYVMMMSIFVISFFFKGNSDVFKARANLSGIRTWKLFLIEAGCAAFMIYFLYVLVFICLFAAFGEMNFLSLLSVIPFFLLIAAAGTALCYLIKSPATVSYIAFGVVTGLMYVSGGLLPLEYMPHFFTTVSAYNPIHYLIMLFTRSMFL
ncbi:MAG: ABC transporter permease [Clostridiales bacterium]|nr:ABC transporter permease [Clostridiales bacterium]